LAAGLHPDQLGLLWWSYTALPKPTSWISKEGQTGEKKGEETETAGEKKGQETKGWKGRRKRGREEERRRKG